MNRQISLTMFFVFAFSWAAFAQRPDRYSLCNGNLCLHREDEHTKFHPETICYPFVERDQSAGLGFGIGQQRQQPTYPQQQGTFGQQPSTDQPGLPQTLNVDQSGRPALPEFIGPFTSWDQSLDQLEITGESIEIGEMLTLEEYQRQHARQDFRFDERYYHFSVPFYVGDDPAKSIGKVIEPKLRYKLNELRARVSGQSRYKLRGYYVVRIEKTKVRGFDGRPIAFVATDIADRWNNETGSTILYGAGAFMSLFQRSKMTRDVEMVFYLELWDQAHNQMVFGSKGFGKVTITEGPDYMVAGAFGYSLEFPAAEPLAEQMVASALPATRVTTIRTDLTDLLKQKRFLESELAAQKRVNPETKAVDGLKAEIDKLKEQLAATKAASQK